MDRKTVLLALVLLFVGSAVTIGQKIVVEVNLTTLCVRVEDEHGSPALNLSADDFQVFEGGEPRPISHFSLETEPMTVGLLVDRSISVGSKKRQIVDTLVETVTALNADDQAFFMTFSVGTNLEVATTNDRNRILSALRRLKTAAGTRFYDASVDALDELSRSRRARKALIVVSDGADHYSIHTFQQLLRYAELYRAAIYIIGYTGDDSATWTVAGRSRIRNEFSQLAEATGGQVFFPSGSEESPQIAKQIVAALHHEYRISFYSSNSFGESLDLQVQVRGARRVTILPDSTPFRLTK